MNRQRKTLTLATCFLAVLATLILIGACTKQTPTPATAAPAAKTAEATKAADKPVKGQLSTIGDGEDEITVLQVWGSPYQMGYAHGRLCKQKVKKFYNRFLGAAKIAMGADLSLLDKAWKQMEPYVADRYMKEMKGLAEGAGIDIKTVHRVHAVPDVSEFHCTFFAAWGQATKDRKLHQIRALDYETRAGIQNEPALIVYQPNGYTAFVEVGWIGFIGCVSGMSEKQIAVSEIGEHFSDNVETLAGESMPFLIRRVLEQANSMDEGVNIIKQADRTSSYLYCVGDGKIPAARKLRTSDEFCEVYGPDDDETNLDNVVYWSMGTDSDWNAKVENVLADKYGAIDETVGMIDIMRNLGTGDLHAIHFIPADLKLWVANATPTPENAPAYNENFVQFNMAEFLK